MTDVGAQCVTIGTSTATAGEARTVSGVRGNLIGQSQRRPWHCCLYPRAKHGTRLEKTPHVKGSIDGTKMATSGPATGPMSLPKPPRNRHPARAGAVI